MTLVFSEKQKCKYTPAWESRFVPDRFAGGVEHCGAVEKELLTVAGRSYALPEMCGALGKMETLSLKAVVPTGAPVAPVILDSPRQWFAVLTKSHHEKRVAQQYTERQIDHFLPLYRTVHNWTNYRKVTLELPLFPNYMFVRITRQERLRALVVSGVLSLVGRGNEPTPLPDFEIDLLRTGLHQRSFEPYPHLATGAKARIKSGALAGMEGIVLHKKNSFRVVLTVDLIMQSFAVEVDASELEPAG